MNTVLKTIFRSLLRLQRQQYQNRTLVFRKPLEHEWGVAGWKNSAQISVTLNQLLPFVDSEATELHSDQMRELMFSYFHPERRNPQSTTQALETVRILSEQVRLDQCSSTCLTKGVQIDVTSAFHSHAKQEQANVISFIFSYRIAISYTGAGTVQLKSRNWLLQECGKDWIDIMPRGSPGVVGLYPVFGRDSRNGGMIFQYTSSCVSRTPTAFMKGTFQMANMDQKTSFDAVIAPFRLVSV